jgi:putative transposase
MKFESDKIYHIYNRGNNSQQIFFERENFIFFLQKIRKHLMPLVDILAYCLMSNHFHIFIYVSEKTKNSQMIHQVASSHLMDTANPDDISKSISDAIAIILRSYTQAINKRFNRTGSLFQSRTKSKNTLDFDVSYPFTCFHYIHQNPVKSNLVNEMEDWEFSSYRDYSGHRNGSLCNKVLANELLEIPIDIEKFVSQSKAVKLTNFKLNS